LAGCLLVGNCPTATIVVQLIVKTVPALIYRNESLVTIKENIEETKKMRIYANFGNYKS